MSLQWISKNLILNYANNKYDDGTTKPIPRNATLMLFQSSIISDMVSKCLAKIPATCGLYYKPMMIVNDDARVINKLEASLTDDASRVVIYDRHMFIVQATGGVEHKS